MSPTLSCQATATMAFMSNTQAPTHFSSVPLDKSYRLMNHGPTVLVSARHAGQDNVMAAAWACVLDYGQTPKVTVVLDKATHTRKMIEASGWFALQLPTVAQVALTTGVGSESLRDAPDKLARHGVSLFDAPGFEVPLVAGCAGWLVCRHVSEPHNEQVYDLFIGEVKAAWADERVFANGRWCFDVAHDGLRTIHHVAGGQFMVSGRDLKT
jgi:flavin reductase (DIM6/NTAB) family NADH-FMN oxidoreductase RutF